MTLERSKTGEPSLKAKKFNKVFTEASVDYLRSKDYAPTTIYGYGHKIDIFGNFLQSRDVSSWAEVTGQTVIDFRNWQESVYRPKSINENRALGLYFAWLIENGYPLNIEAVEQLQSPHTHHDPAD